MSHIDKIKDADAFFEVNPITRQIINKTPTKIVLMQGDHNSERFTFSLPRYIEGHDMAESAKTKVHYINASKGYDGRYDVKDLRIDPDNPENVICSWLISGNVTKEAGALVFLIEFDCYEGDVLVYSWHTQQHKGISIGETFDCSEELAEMYADVLQQWEDALFSANAEGVKNIATAKADALGSIETTRTKAISDIESTNETETAEAINKIVTKGRETLESIPDDYVALDAKVEQSIAISDKTRIIQNANGSMHALSDSAEAPIQSMRIFGKSEQFTTTGKNKLPYPYVSKGTTTVNGVTFTDNGDGSVTCSGACTATGVGFTFSKDFPFEAGKTYSMTPKSNNVVMYCNYLNESGKDAWATNTITWRDGYSLKAIYLQVAAGDTASGTFYPIIVEGSTYDGNWEPYTGGMTSPNPDYPQKLKSVGNDGSVEQFVKGKNWLDEKAVAPISVNTEGTKRYGWDLGVLPKGNYTLTVYGNYTESKPISYKIITNGVYGDYVSLTVATKSRHIALDGTQKLIVYLFQDVTSLYDNITLQLESGTVATPYEPYKSQSLIISTPNGLPGIPVSSDGNYTDENGKQWICDEIDLERGVKVQRIGEYRNTGEAMNMASCALSSDGKRIYWNTPVLTAIYFSKSLSSHFGQNDYGVETRDYLSKFQYNNYLYFSVPIGATEYGTTYATHKEAVTAWLAKTFSDVNPLIVKYQLATPIETPLTEEEISAYKALHTNYPNTTIYNDDGAYTEVKYVADTKNYVDNKIANEVAKLAAAVAVEN